MMLFSFVKTARLRLSVLPGIWKGLLGSELPGECGKVALLAVPLLGEPG